MVALRNRQFTAQIMFHLIMIMPATQKVRDQMAGKARLTFQLFVLLLLA